MQLHQGPGQLQRERRGRLTVPQLDQGLAPSETAARSRGQDDEGVIAGRMAEAVEEMSHYEDGDYLVVNDDFDTALADLEAIFRSLRLAVAYQEKQHDSLLAELLANR